MDLLDITPLKTNKDELKRNPMMDAGIIPAAPVSALFCAPSGQGKTNLLLTLLTKPHFYKGYFDHTFVFSETAKEGADDLYEQHLDIPKDCYFLPNEEGIAQLQHIMKTQKGIIKKKGLSKAPKILVVFDDIAHSKRFLNSPTYFLLHLANRHYNITTFSLTQSYTAIPRKCRSQVGGVFYFHGCTGTEDDRLSEEHCPADMYPREFKELIHHATSKKHSFMYINKQVDEADRYRSGLKKILSLNR